MTRRRLAVRQRRRHDSELLGRQSVHGFGDRGEVVEHILQPRADRDFRLVGVGGTVVGFREIQDIADQTRLVDAIDRGDVVNRGDDRTVFRGPRHRAFADAAIACHTLGKGPEIGPGVVGPIHAAADNIVVAARLVENARAGVAVCHRASGGHARQRHTENETPKSGLGFFAHLTSPENGPRWQGRTRIRRKNR